MKWPFRGVGTAPLSREEELLINQQAATVAASVLSEAVLAATRCEPAEKATRFTANPLAPGRVYHSTQAWENYMRTHGLPSSFILAVTAGRVHALEDKHDGGQLLPGRVLKAWGRSAVLIRVPTDQVQRIYEPAGDRQVVLLWLPIDKDDPVPQATAEGVGGVLHKFIVARDAPSQRLIAALPPAPKGQFVYRDAIARATVPPPQPSAATATPSQPHAAQRLQELETLRAMGAISDAEYTAKREQIISEI